MVRNFGHPGIILFQNAISKQNKCFSIVTNQRIWIITCTNHIFVTFICVRDDQYLVKFTNNILFIVLYVVYLRRLNKKIKK